MRAIGRKQPLDQTDAGLPKPDAVPPRARAPNSAGAIATWVLLALLLWWLVVLVSALVRDFWVILIAWMQP